MYFLLILIITLIKCQHFRYAGKNNYFYILAHSPYVLILLLMSHHFNPLSSAKGLVGLSLWEMVFRSHVSTQLDGLLRRSLVGLVLLIELLEQ